MDFNWKLFHGQVNAETKLKAMGFSDGFCKICKIEQENTEHIFICKDIENFWSKLEETLEIIDMNLPITRFQQMVGVLNEGYRVGNSLLLGHCPFGLDVNLIFKGTEASWEGTKATFHPSPGAPRPV